MMRAGVDSCLVMFGRVFVDHDAQVQQGQFADRCFRPAATAVR